MDHLDYSWFDGFGDVEVEVNGVNKRPLPSCMIWLYNSRIIATFAVVFLHVSALAVTGNDIGTYNWWVGNVYDSLARWCVPVFVMISGALLLDQNKKEELKVFYLKRISRILIPLLFWSVFFLLLVKLVKGETLSLYSLTKRILSGKPYYHMWFLYMIAMLYLFTPFFRKIVSDSSVSEIKILIFSTFILSALNAIFEKIIPGHYKVFTNLFLSYIPYFFLGHLVQTSKENYYRCILWCIFIVSVILTAFGCYIVARKNGTELGFYFYSYLSITVIPMSISVMYILKSWTMPIISEKFIRKVSSLTLGVYLIHPVFLDIIVWARYSPCTSYQAVLIPLVSIVVFGLSLCAVWIINRISWLKRVV